jgi:hypothetical protein
VARRREIARGGGSLGSWVEEIMAEGKEPRRLQE